MRRRALDRSLENKSKMKTSKKSVTRKLKIVDNKVYSKSKVAKVSKVVSSKKLTSQATRKADSPAVKKEVRKSNTSMKVSPKQSSVSRSRSKNKEIVKLTAELPIETNETKKGSRRNLSNDTVRKSQSNSNNDLKRKSRSNSNNETKRRSRSNVRVDSRQQSSPTALNMRGDGSSAVKTDKKSVVKKLPDRKGKPKISQSAPQSTVNSIGKLIRHVNRSTTKEKSNSNDKSIVSEIEKRPKVSRTTRSLSSSISKTGRTGKQDRSLNQETTKNKSKSENKAESSVTEKKSKEGIKTTETSSIKMTRTPRKSSDQLGGPARQINARQKVNNKKPLDNSLKETPRKRKAFKNEKIESVKDAIALIDSEIAVNKLMKSQDEEEKDSFHERSPSVKRAVGRRSCTPHFLEKPVKSAGSTSKGEPKIKTVGPSKRSIKDSKKSSSASDVKDSAKAEMDYEPAVKKRKANVAIQNKRNDSATVTVKNSFSESPSTSQAPTESETMTKKPTSKGRKTKATTISKQDGAKKGKSKIQFNMDEEDPYDFEAYLSTITPGKLNKKNSKQGTKEKTLTKRPKQRNAWGGVSRKVTTPAHKFFIQPTKVKRKPNQSESVMEEPSPSIAEEIVEFTLQPPFVPVDDDSEEPGRPSAARLPSSTMLISTPHTKLTAAPLMRPPGADVISPIAADNGTSSVTVLVESKANSPKKREDEAEMELEHAEADNPSGSNCDSASMEKSAKKSSGGRKGISKKQKEVDEFELWLAKFSEELSEIESFQLSIDHSQ